MINYVFISFSTVQIYDYHVFIWILHLLTSILRTNNVTSFPDFSLIKTTFPWRHWYWYPQYNFIWQSAALYFHFPLLFFKMSIYLHSKYVPCLFPYHEELFSYPFHGLWQPCNGIIGSLTKQLHRSISNRPRRRCKASDGHYSSLWGVLQNSTAKGSVLIESLENIDCMHLDCQENTKIH